MSLMMQRSSLLSCARPNERTVVSGLRPSVICTRHATQRTLITAQAHLDRRAALHGLATVPPLLLTTLGATASKASAEAPQDAAVQAVAQAYRKYLTGDLAGVLAACSPNITWRIPAFAGSPFKDEYRGVQGVQDFFTDLNKAETPSKFDVVKVVGSGNNAVGIISYSSKVKATGKTYSTEFVQAWTIDDSGALLTMKEYFADSAAFAAAYAS